MAGKFETYEDKAGLFRFRLKASNGQVVAVNEQSYGSRDAAKAACESVQAAAGTADAPAPIEEV
jgi:hypothetical protein